MDLQDQIAANRKRSSLLFVVLIAIVWGAFVAFGILYGMPPELATIIGLTVALVYVAIGRASGVSSILAATKARPANPNHPLERRLLNAVEEISIAAAMPMPKVYVQPSKDLNAFAAGYKPEDAILCMTEGALEVFDREEMQGVVAHEMAHIQNRDVKVATTAIALIGLIAILGEILWWRLIFGGGGGNRDNRMDPRMQLLFVAVALVFIILAPILSRMTYLAISRQREYLADASGARFTRNPEGLARALEKIRDRAPAHGTKEDRTVAALYIANPFKRVKSETLWSTHPPLETRIARLRGQE